MTADAILCHCEICNAAFKFNNYKKANVLSNLQCVCKSCHQVAEAKRSMVQMVLPMQDNPKRGHRPKKVAADRLAADL